MEEVKQEIKWRDLAYLLANALADEIHYSQTPSQDTLDLLAKMKEEFPDTPLTNRFEEMNIFELKPVE